MDITKHELDNVLIKLGSITAYSNLFIVNELKKSGIEGIHPSHGAVIEVLIHSDEPVHLAKLVEATGRVKSTITVMVRTLEKHGFVKRYKIPENKKSVFVELTPKGRDIEEKLETLSKLLIEKVYGDMPVKERKQLITSLNKIQNNISDQTIEE